ncbi:HypC/HybG/HupF family hydrogenase formation chaperone [Amycolatopsis sp. NPDC005003]
MSAGGAGRQAGPVCHDGVCITCSDTAVEVTVVELLDLGLAVVDTGSGREEVSVALVEAGVGDRILVHAGEAIALLEKPRS